MTNAADLPGRAPEMARSVNIDHEYRIPDERVMKKTSARRIAA
jgi:hypothetical protein